MVTFGFSAYLRLIALNSRPQRTELKKRLSPKKGGYDFHRSMRTGMHRFIVEQVPIGDVLRSFEQIVKTAEQRSAREALGRMVEWRRNNTGDIFDIPPAIYESPNSIFKVRFTPDFGIVLRGRRTAVHVWNTKSPEITARQAQIGLALFPDTYDEQDLPPMDLAVLSLRNSQIYRLGSPRDYSIAARATAIGVEMLFENIRDEMRLPAPPSADRRAPPPA